MGPLTDPMAAGFLWTLMLLGSEGQTKEEVWQTETLTVEEERNATVS